MKHPAPPSPTLDFLAGGGEMAARMRAHDWSSSPLGPPQTWPQSLRTVVALMANSKFPMFVAWGPRLAFLYNDGYIPIFGAKHPAALGLPFAEVWSEIWDEISPIVDRALAGEASYFENLHLVMQRNGVPEETYFTFSYSPVRDEAGAVAGLFCACTETTGQVMADRARQRLIDVIEQSPDLIGLADPEGRAVYVNEAGQRMVGLTPDRVREARVIDFFAPEDRPHVESHLLAAVQREGRWQGTYRARNFATGASVPFDGTLFATRDASGAFLGIAAVARDITEREAAERRQAFLSDLSDRLRVLSDPVEVLTIAAEALGRHLGVAQVGYGRIDTPHDVLTVMREWNDGRMPSIAGTWQLAAFSAEAIAEIKRGRNLVIDDVARDRRTAAGAVVSAYAAIGVRATLSIPLVKDKRLVAVLFVHHPEPRSWSAEDVALVRSVAERSWAAVERAQAEAALRESEERLRLGTAVADFGTYDWDVAADVHRWSPETHRIYGIEPGTPITIDLVSALIHPEDRARGAAANAAGLDPAGTGRIENEYRVVRPDGTLRWIRTAAQVMFSDGPERRPIRMVGAVQDVTERRLAEEALRRLNESLEAQVEERTRERDRLWHTSRDLMCVARVDGTLLSVNPAWERLLGWRAEELVGRNAAEVKHPDDDARTRAELARLAEGRSTLNFEDRYRHRDGSWRWISWACDPASSAAQREADALYRAYFANTAESLFVIGVLPDGGFTIEELNPAHEASTGLRTAELRGKRLEEQLPPDVVEAVTANYRRAVQSGLPQHYRETIDLPNGLRHWDTVLVPVRDPQGRIVRLIGSARDVTSQVQAEEALRQAQKMEAVGQLTGGIAHDFNNLLTAVVGSIDLIRRRSADDRTIRLAENAMKAAERGMKLTGQLLAFSRTQRLALGAVPVNAAIQGMGGLLATTIGSAVTVRFALDPEAGAALTDVHQLELAILNLAINARDALAGDSGGTITISTGRVRIGPRGVPGIGAELPQGEHVVVSVADNGPGMPAAVVARAFDPFFTTKPVGQGTGLGLSQVYGIARQSGGGARIESHPGRGTTVRLYLPVTTAEGDEAEDGDPVAVGDPAAAARGCVLVVDDDPDVRTFLTDTLDTFGYRVLAADNGPEGLALFERARPDLLILDFAMPGMNGAEVAEAARRRPGQPILFVSGYADTAALERAAGDAGVLRKPFRAADLAAAVQAAVSGAVALR